MVSSPHRLDDLVADERYAAVAEEIREMTDLFLQASATLRKWKPHPNDMESIKAIISCDGFGNRHFHKLKHFLDVAGARNSHLLADALSELGANGAKEAIQATMIRAAGHHDVVYYQYDHKFASGVEGVLAPFVAVDSTAKPETITVQEPPEGTDRVIFNLVNTLFGVKPGDKLNPFNGQNEYLSALFAGEMGVKSEIPLKYIIGEMAMIEATVPWGDRDRFSTLQARLEQANERLPGGVEKLSSAEIKGMIAGAAAVANIDVQGIGGDFLDFHEGTLNIMRESGAKLEDAATRMKSVQGQINFLTPLLADSQSGKRHIFHSYAVDNVTLPPLAITAERETRAQKNIAQELDYLHAQLLADALVLQHKGGEETLNDEAFGKVVEIVEEGRRAPPIRGKTAEMQKIESSAQALPMTALAVRLMETWEPDAVRRMGGEITQSLAAGSPTPVVDSKEGQGKVHEKEAGKPR